MSEIKWKMADEPTGKFKAFSKRGWPMGYYSDGKPALSISCEDAYRPANVKTGDHGPLIVRIAQHHTDPAVKAEKGAFTWRKLKSEFKTLDEAKKAGEKAVKNHPEFKS